MKQFIALLTDCDMHSFLDLALSSRKYEEQRQQKCIGKKNG
jgi:hypothetical protein